MKAGMRMGRVAGVRVGEGEALVTSGRRCWGALGAGEGKAPEPAAGVAPPGEVEAGEGDKWG